MREQREHRHERFERARRQLRTDPASSGPRAPARLGTAAVRRSSEALPESSGAAVRAVEPEVEVRRSRNRVRTVTAFREGDRTVVAIPARFTRAQEREWVRRMVTRLAEQEARRRPSDTGLAARAAELSTRYLGGRAVPSSVTWSSKQGRRWGSCTSLDGTIRISDRVRGMPSWVLDYVLLHELTHLLHAGHGPDFWAELEAYPRTARARGFLEGFAFLQDGGGRSGLSDEGAVLDEVGADLADDEVAVGVELDEDLDEELLDAGLLARSPLAED